MFYFIKTPGWLKKILYPSLIWNIDTTEKILYLTFDDGPHEKATPFALDQLKKYNAKATFFCLGKNVIEQQNIYQRILDEGHKAGNHTFNHLNGWKTKDNTYFENIAEAAKHIDSKLFRPPYGRITRFQAKTLNANTKYKIIMWDVLSGDFDISLSREKCFQNVALNAKPGSIIVFHDSEKAFERMSYALPKLLKHFTDKGYRFEALS